MWFQKPSRTFAGRCSWDPNMWSFPAVGVAQRSRPLPGLGHEHMQSASNEHRRRSLRRAQASGKRSPAVGVAQRSQRLGGTPVWAFPALQ
jgi:hypothetical protein